MSYVLQKFDNKMLFACDYGQNIVYWRLSVISLHGEHAFFQYTKIKD